MFRHYWPFVRGGTNQLPVDSRHKRTINVHLLLFWIRLWTCSWEPTQLYALTLITARNVTLIVIPMDARLGALQTNCQRKLPEYHQIWICLWYMMICTWINGWVSSREAGDLRRHHAHYDVTVMNMHEVCCNSNRPVIWLLVVLNNLWAWISNKKPRKCWDVIIYPRPLAWILVLLNHSTTGVNVQMTDHIPQNLWDVITYVISNIWFNVIWCTLVWMRTSSWTNGRLDGDLRRRGAHVTSV